jgi:thiol-disulfide isomerase/thioredoxin
VCGALAGCGGGGRPSSLAAPGPAEAGGALEIAPDFELASLDGSKFRLSESAGKVRLLDFWATWCAPCREEIPMLNDLHDTYGAAGLEIVAISDEDSEVIRDFVESAGVRYRNLVGTVELAEQYQVLGLPTAYLIDGEGRIVEAFLGPKPRKVLTERIRELLEGSPQT